MNGLQGILTNHTPMWAMFADDDGKAIARKVYCLGVMQTATDEKNNLASRMVMGYVIVQGLAGGNGEAFKGGPLGPADFIEGFIGYSEDPGTGAFDKAARECRAMITKARAAAKAKGAIIVPDNKLVTAALAQAPTPRKQ